LAIGVTEGEEPSHIFFMGSSGGTTRMTVGVCLALMIRVVSGDLHPVK
jgi:hypothetical protein